MHVLYTICTVLVLNAIPLLASGGTDNKPANSEDPREILKRAADEMKKVQCVSYTAEYDSTTWLKAFVSKVSGTVILGQEKEYELVEFYCDVTLRPNKSEEESRFQAGSNGDTFFLIDPKTKTMYQDMDQAVLGSHSREIQRVVLRDFSSPEPLKELLESETVESRGTQTVDDQLCHKVYIKTDDGRERIWSFSVRDFLPRHVERLWKNRKDELGSTLLTLTNLKVNPKLDGRPFNPAVPPGYTKTDDFAP